MGREIQAEGTGELKYLALIGGMVYTDMVIYGGTAAVPSPGKEDPMCRHHTAPSQFRTLLCLLLQCTWGLVQTALGAAVFLRYLKRPHTVYRGALVTEYPLLSSLSLGPFIFLTDRPPRDRSGNIPNSEVPGRLLVHEYGHTIQSLLLGPLYLPVVGLPSALWNHLPLFQRKWRGGVSYFSFFTERTANYLGEKFTGEKSMGFAIL